ncbi:MAG: DUF4139 domain-containing protein [Sphingomonadaceae bacterium]
MLFVLATPAQSQPIVSSADPTDIAVTIYRDPDRRSGAMDRQWPRGYALISETRTIRLPAGDSMVRFEGVAEGLMPETAIVTGLPKGVREKNRDARLLSPARLIDAYLKRRVYLVRTDRATGRRTEQEAIIQSGPDGGVLLTTKDGVEALGCSGLSERMRYDGVPTGLTAKPSLSVLTTADRATTATVTLTYIAQGFDWSADYIATTNPGGKTLRLFAWLTVANGGTQSFRDARLQVIAGTANRDRRRPPAPIDRGAPLQLKCWPSDVTSTHPSKSWEQMALPPGIDLTIYNDIGFNLRAYKLVRYRGRYVSAHAPMAIAAMAASGGDSYGMAALAGRGSAMRSYAASLESLGDLKLYRVPLRTTVAAQSQKQVAMIDQPLAAFDPIYSNDGGTTAKVPLPMTLWLRMKNKPNTGLGLPLPAGRFAVFEPGVRDAMFAGASSVADRAVGEDVEVAVRASSDVRFTLARVIETDMVQRWRADITNALPHPVRAEIVVAGDLVEPWPGMTRGRGGWRLPVDVPANGSATVRYRLNSDQRP